MIATPNNLIRPFVFCLATISLLLAGVIYASPPVTAQDQGDQADATQQPPTDNPDVETPDAERPAAKQNEEGPAKKTLYFIGPKVSAERQQGPSIGAPTSILPKPLVPKGSVPMPVPEDMLALLPAAQDGAVTKPPTKDGIDPDKIDDQPPADAPPIIDGALQPVNGVQADGAEVADPDDVGDIQEGALERIDPSGLAVDGLANPIETVWQGYDRADVTLFLGQLAQPSLSPTLTRLAGSIAGSGFSLPAPDGLDDIIKVIDARLSVFEATANAKAYIGLIEGLPSDGDWSALSRHLARAHLLKSELTDACLIAETERERDADPYWVRLAAFCMAATGNRTGVDFQLGILEETIQVEPVFYQLLDQILIEAEQPPGAILSEPITLRGAIQADILTAAMARLARARVPAIAATGLNPLAVPLLLENPSLSIEAQSMLVAYLIERGIADGEAIAAFARSVSLQDGEGQAALAFAAQAAQSPADQGQPDVAVDLAQVTDTAPDAGAVAPVVDDNRLQTTLLALIAGAGGDAQKIPAFDYFWQHAEKGGKQAAVAPVLTALIQPEGFADLTLVTPNLRARLARLEALSGDQQNAGGWSRGLRTSVAGQNLDVDRALVDLWPLLTFKGDNLAVNSASRLALWWQQQAASPQAFQRANLLFSLIDAAGSEVSNDLWLKLTDGPGAFEGVTISPALWRQFELNIQNKDPLAAISSLYRLLSEVGPAELPPAISGVLVSGLMRLGFEDTARALALEVLISQKL